MKDTQEETILFCITGGTIDSYYDGVKDTVVPRPVSIIPAYIQSFKLRSQPSFVNICMKDSRDVTDGDRAKLLATLEETDAKRVVITHGTYTMPDTARYLKKHLKRHDQKIILTGSMIPLGGVSPSDGGFNLGFAMAGTLTLQPGVYVCMNGQIFDPENVRKVIEKGVFDTAKVTTIL